METIIVQDSDKVIFDMLTKPLNLEGFQVYPVLNTDQDFITLIQEHHPNLVMLEAAIIKLTSFRSSRF